MVKEVGRRHLPAQTRTFFRELEVLQQAEMEHADPRADDDALGRRAVLTRLGRRESPGVEPAVDATLIRGQVRITNLVGAARYVGRRAIRAERCPGRVRAGP